MFYQDKTFTGERVELSGRGFHGCTFKDCELVYRGDPSPNFQDNNLVDSVFVFADSAICTLYFLSNIYHAGRGGRELFRLGRRRRGRRGRGRKRLGHDRFRGDRVREDWRVYGSGSFRLRRKDQRV